MAKAAGAKKGSTAKFKEGEIVFAMDSGDLYEARVRLYPVKAVVNNLDACVSARSKSNCTPRWKHWCNRGTCGYLTEPRGTKTAQSVRPGAARREQWGVTIMLNVEETLLWVNVQVDQHPPHL